MKLRSFFYALAAGTIVLLLVAVAGFFWITSQSPLSLLQKQATTTPTAAIFVPKQAPIMVSLLVNPDRLEAFRQLVARPVNRRRSRAELNQIENSLLSNTGIDYRRDIRPWIGNEITLAVTSLDFDRDRENAAQPGYLLAVTTKDAKAARDFLQVYYSQQALAGTEDLVFETYKGVNLIYKRPLTPVEVSTGSQNETTLTSAVVGDRFVLFANHPQVLKAAINNVQAVNLSLDSDRVYQQTLQSLTESTQGNSQPILNRIGMSFINLPSLTAWISQQPMSKKDTLQGSETLAVSLSLNRQGLLAQTALLGAQLSDESFKPTLSQPVDALQYIPRESAASVAGTNLNQLWQQLSAGAANNETLQALLDRFLTSLQSRWGIQLPEEIFSWVQGDYAISMLPRPDKAEPDWIFVAQKTPESTAQTAIEHLDTLAKQQGLSVGLLPLKDKTITAWTKLTTSTTNIPGQNRDLMKLEAIVGGVHTTVGEYEIFANSIEAMDEALGGLENSLLNSDKFKQAIAPLPEQNDGYLYLDWASSGTFIKRQVPIVQVVELLAKPLFDHLQGLSVSSYGIDNGIQRSKLFFQLGNRV